MQGSISMPLACDPLGRVPPVLLRSRRGLGGMRSSVRGVSMSNCAWRDHRPRAQVPIIAQVRTRKLEVLEREPLATQLQQ